jgi:hypothetical protein
MKQQAHGIWMQAGGAGAGFLSSRRFHEAGVGGHATWLASKRIQGI